MLATVLADAGLAFHAFGAPRVAVRAAPPPAAVRLASPIIAQAEQAPTGDVKSVHEWDAEEGRWQEEVEEFGNARIDQPQVEEDAAAWAETQAPASGDELSAHLPDWAKPILREREAYEREQKTQRAAEFRPVDGRMWEEGGDSAGGLRDFTPEEIADDYSLPLESVVAELEEIGVPAAKLEPPWRPLKEVCSPEQESSVLDFVSTADPIALRSLLAPDTVEDLADELELPVDLLTDLCARHGVRLAAGPQTRLPVAEHAILAERAETERAFRE